MDLHQQDPIAGETFAEMLNDKEAFPYGIDVIETLTIDPKTGTPWHHYLHATGLRGHMYVGVNSTQHPVNRLPLERRFLYSFYVKDMKTPLVRKSLDEVIPRSGYSGLLSIASMYASGQLGNKIKEDYDRARQYFKEAAEQAVHPSVRAQAQGNLAKMNADGL